MTIKHKIFTTGAITFLMLVALSFVNIWTYQQVLSNLDIRDEVNQELAAIEEFADWRNTLIRTVTNISGSGHTPDFAYEQFDPPSEIAKFRGAPLIQTGKPLVDISSRKEKLLIDTEKYFSKTTNEINTLYSKLDEEIATVLAIAQMDQLFERDTSEVNALAPYVLKSLNQLTLVAHNMVISRRFTETQRGAIEKNKQFLNSQLHIIDKNGTIDSLFQQLYLQIDSLEAFIRSANRSLSETEKQISKATEDFEKAASATEIGPMIADAQTKVKEANQKLKNASRLNLFTVAVFMLIVPVFVVIVGLFGLNNIIIRPIDQLIHAMKNVENGCFEVHATEGANDEIGALAKTFNTMANEIKTKVTELSKLNETLLISESKYRTLVNNLPQKVFLKDHDLKYVSCNELYAQDLGIRAEDIAGRKDCDFFPADMVDKYREDDKKILRTGKSEEFEEEYVINDRKVIVQTVKTPIRDEDGHVSGVLGIFWDITERKQTEEELEKYREHLEELVEKRTEDLKQEINERKKTEVELQRAMKAAESANQAKSVFLANMSHELRTPLNAVLGYSEILALKETDPHKKHQLNSIQASGNSLLSLVNDILDLSKIEAGKMELSYSAVSIPRLFEEMNAIFHEKIASKNLQFIIEVGPNVPEALVLDEIRIRQVLINLLSNAVKFTDKGRVRLYADAESVEAQHQSQIELRIGVEDTGKGIPSDQLEIIFNPFEQVRGQKISEYSGTGLGLSITSNLVKRMGGTIAVESAEGEGSTFQITIENVEVTPTKSLEDNRLEEKELNAIRFEPATILIADDIDYNREMLAAYLERWDFKFIFAENGKEALEKSREYRPNLILLDMRMPVMTGYETAEVLKNDVELSSIPIVAVTASALKQDETQICELCDAYLRKPITQKMLFDEITKHLSYSTQSVIEEENKKDTVETDPLITCAATLPRQKLNTLKEMLLDGFLDRAVQSIQQQQSEYPQSAPFFDFAIKQIRTYRETDIIDLVNNALERENDAARD